MNKRALTIAAFAGFSAFSVPVGAAAETYCRTGYFTRVHDGGTFTVAWDVTVDGARKGLPGRKPTRGCSFRSSFFAGAHRAPEVIAKPSRGTVTVRNKSTIYYRSASPGPDRFTMRYHWISGSKPASAIINFNVTAHPNAL